MNLFQHAVRDGPVTSARLAALSGAEELLIGMQADLVSPDCSAEEGKYD